MNYEKGEQIKSVEELVKSLADKKPHYTLTGLYECTSDHYYDLCSYTEKAIESGEYFHAVPKRDIVSKPLLEKLVTEIRLDRLEKNEKHNSRLLYLYITTTLVMFAYIVVLDQLR